MTPTPTVLVPGTPTTSIDPIYNQQQLTDGQTGNLTESGWWYLFQLRQGTVQALQNSTLTTVELIPVNGIVIPDLSLSGPLGSFHLSSATVTNIKKPIFTGGQVPNGAQITIYYDQDVIGGRPAPHFEVGLGGWVQDVNNLVIIEEISTRTTYRFGYDGQIWTMLAFQTGETTVPA